MEQPNTGTEYTLADIVRTTTDFLKALIHRKWWLLGALVMGALIGGLYRWKLPPTYKAEYKFLLDDRSASVQQGEASGVRINLNNLMNASTAMGNDNMISIMESKAVLMPALLSPMEGEPGRTIADLYTDLYYSRDKLNRVADLRQLSFAKVKDSLTSQQDSLLNDIYRKVVKRNIDVERISPKAAIFTLAVRSGNNELSRQLSQQIFDRSVRLYQKTRTGIDEETLKQVKQQVSGDSTRKTREYLLVQEVAARQSIIEVLDTPARLLADERKPPVFWILAFSLGAAFIYIIYFFLYFLTRRAVG